MNHTHAHRCTHACMGMLELQPAAKSWVIGLWVSWSAFLVPLYSYYRGGGARRGKHASTRGCVHTLFFVLLNYILLIMLLQLF